MTKTTITLEAAQAKLAELIGELQWGDELIITQGDQVVARIIGQRRQPGERLKTGFAIGMISIVADDDEHLKDLADYMP